MACYRKKPAYREAEQFRGFYVTPYPPGLEFEDNSNDPAAQAARGRYAFYVVTTQGQKVYVQPGEYIVKEPNGNGYYPCEAATFEREHELCPEGSE